MATKFKVGDKVRSLVNPCGVTYTVTRVRGGGWVDVLGDNGFDYPKIRTSNLTLALNAEAA